MGGIVDNIFGGGGGDAAKEAGQAQLEGTRLGIEELRRQYDETVARLNPYLQAGLGALPAASAGATLPGLNARLGAIFGQAPAGPAFDPAALAAQIAGSLQGGAPATLPAEGAPATPTGAPVYADFAAPAWEQVTRGTNLSRLNRPQEGDLINAQNQLYNQALSEYMAGGGQVGTPVSPTAPAEGDLEAAIAAALAGIQPQPGGEGGAALQALIDERQKAVSGQLSRGGLTRSGAALQAAADVPTELGLAIEHMLYGRQTGLAGSGQNAAAGLGALGGQTAGQIANLHGAGGQGIADSILAAQQADAQASSNLLGTLGTVAGMFFSDERLKDNMEPIGTLGGMTLYEWDWKPGITSLVGQMSIGFKAQEVAEKYPEFVFEIHDHLAINYPALIEELREAA